MNETTLTLATVIKAVRKQHGWSLREMSAKTGIPTSTLGKVEKGQLSLTYDKLLQVSQRIGISLADLLASGQSQHDIPINGRRSIAREATALPVVRPGYDHLYLCPELHRKRMVPVVSRIRAKSLEEFGDLIRHPGEEFVYVVEGKVRVITEFWDSVVLEPREGVYIDSLMGHAYLAEDCNEATTLSVMTANEDDLATKLIAVFDRNE